MSRNNALAMKSLRLISLYAVTLILTLLGGTTAGFAQGRQQRVSDPTALVDVFIGTGGHGHTHPAACVPHGMIQPGPDTRRMGWDACSGYHYADSLINGFAHQRLSGTGCADYAHHRSTDIGRYADSGAGARRHALGLVLQSRPGVGTAGLLRRHAFPLRHISGNDRHHTRRHSQIYLSAWCR